MGTVLLSRNWLTAIADEFRQGMGLADTEAVRETIQSSMLSARKLLSLPPWHMRILITAIEIAASLWCLIYKIARFGTATPADEIKAFAKCPVISKPLLRLYRSLVAISWFEHPLVLQAYDIQETPEERQERFRQIRDNAA